MWTRSIYGPNYSNYVSTYIFNILAIAGDNQVLVVEFKKGIILGIWCHDHLIFEIVFITLI
jgi:hypothetical protein